MREGAEPAYLIYRGTDLDSDVYRVVSKEPPTEDDFIPYAASGRSFKAKLFFRATGVSMFTKRDEAVKLARGGTLGRYVARVNVRHPDLYFALTNERTGHVTVWGPPRALLECVVDSVDEGGG